MNVTAEVSRENILTAADKNIDGVRKELTRIRTNWIASRKGKRRGFLWLKTWDDNTLNAKWVANHSYVAYEVRSHNMFIDYYLKKLFKLVTIKDMASNKNLASIRLDQDAMSLLGLI